MELPSEISLLHQDPNWTQNPKKLFNNVDSAKPCHFNKQTKPGQFVSVRMTILDQIDPEIFFPIVRLENDSTGEVQEKLTVFRESVEIPGKKYCHSFRGKNIVNV
jgi:hypothetical protein